MFCKNCGAPIGEGARFCTSCGLLVDVNVPQPEIIESTPVVEIVEQEEGLSAIEKEFIETTKRLLRWEQKAWHISGLVMIIMGAVFLGLFTLIGFATMLSDSEIGAVMFVYAFMYGSFIVIGIINKVAEKKIPYYLCTIDTDFRPTLDRCTSIGILVLSILFNTIALVFFVINFARLKGSQATINSIIAKQK